MNAHKLLVPSLLLVLAAGCNEDTAPNTPGEFGEACVPGANDDTPDGCVAGTDCYKGYCEERCLEDVDCQPVEGWDHSCELGLCQIWCDADKGCPTTLGSAMTCDLTTTWCKAGDS